MPRFFPQKTLKTLSISFSAFILTTSISVAEERKHQEKQYGPEVYASAETGNVRSIGRAGFLIPVLQNPKNLTFIDLRGMTDLHNNEGNLGLGYRRKCATFLGDSIMGLYGYFDHRRSKSGNKFSQITVGGELLSDHTDLRLNAYIPLVGSHVLKKDKDQRRLVTKGRYVYAQNKEEIPYYGFDIEAGRAAPSFMSGARFYVGFYHFNASKAPSMNGFRLRTKMHIGRFLALEGTIQKDNLRHFRYYIGFSLCSLWRRSARHPLI